MVKKKILFYLNLFMYINLFKFVGLSCFYAYLFFFFFFRTKNSFVIFRIKNKFASLLKSFLFDLPCSIYNPYFRNFLFFLKIVLFFRIIAGLFLFFLYYYNISSMSVFITFFNGWNLILQKIISYGQQFSHFYISPEFLFCYVSFMLYRLGRNLLYSFFYLETPWFGILLLLLYSIIIIIFCLRDFSKSFKFLYH